MDKKILLVDDAAFMRMLIKDARCASALRGDPRNTGRSAAQRKFPVFPGNCHATFFRRTVQTNGSE